MNQLTTNRQAEAVPHHPEADTFQFRGALQALAQAVTGYAWVVAAITALTLALVTTYVYVWPPVYQAEVLLAIDSDKDAQRIAFYQGWNVFRKESLNDEAALMISPPVLREAARRLQLRYDDVYHPFMRYALHLWTTSWLGKNWRAFKRWVRGVQQDSHLTEEQSELYKMLQDLGSGVTLIQQGEANLGTLVVRASNAKVADLANTIIQVYLEQRTERHTAEARQAYASLAGETSRIGDELDQLGKRIREFRSASGAVLLFERDRGNLTQYTNLRTSIIDLDVVVAENRAALQVLDAQLLEEGNRLRSDRLFREEAVKERLPKLELALATVRQSYRADSREVRELEAQIREAQAGFEESGANVVVRSAARMGEAYEVLRAKRVTAHTAYEGAMSALAVKRAELARVQVLLEQIPSKIQTDHELQRTQSLLENKYAGLQSKLAIAAVSLATASSAPPALRVVEPARVPEQEIAPQTKLLLLAGLLAGLMVGTLVALLLDNMLARATRTHLLRRPGIRLLGVMRAPPGMASLPYQSGPARLAN